MFTNVIVKKPSESYSKGLTTANLGKVDYGLLLKQHEEYVSALEKCNVSINYLEADEAFPDSTFVEDTAVLTKDFAVLSNPGATTRNGEIHSVLVELQKSFEKIYTIETPGFLDGGDVLQADDVFYIGLSERTNENGAQQLKAILESENYSAHVITLEKFFHLKTGIAYLGNNKMVVAGEFIENPLFDSYDKITIPIEDEYSANCILVNDYIILPSGYESTTEKFKLAGFDVIEVGTSEFQKQDGGVSCLSLRF